MLKSHVPQIHIEDKASNQFQQEYIRRLLNLENEFNKLTYSRQKRGLINALGSVIKFIAGNPDNSDLIMLNKNFDSLFKNQEQELTKINQITTLANSITLTLEKEQHNINKFISDINLKLSENDQSTEQRIYLQRLIWCTDETIQKIQMFERTISLARNDIPNLEMITIKQLEDIQTFLEASYSKDQLLHLNKLHPFEIEYFAKNVIFMQGNYLIDILKIPILKPRMYTYSEFYPIPNAEGIVITSEDKHLLNSKLWTTSPCKSIGGEFVCEAVNEFNQCDLKNLSTCDSVVLKGNYKQLVVLNSALLVSVKLPLEILENCALDVKKISVRYNAIVHSNCTVIIDESLYHFKPTLVNNSLNYSLGQIQQITPKFETIGKFDKIDFRNLHKKIKLIESTPIHLSPVFHIIQSSALGIIIVILIISLVAIYLFRQRLYQLFCRKNVILKIPRNADGDIHLNTRPLTEDGQA